MDVKAFLLDWIAASNSFDTKKYLNKYHKNGLLDDPSVGEKFAGHKGIRDYYERYFIGYNTQTKLLRLSIEDNKAHMEVEFTGTFPGGKINGLFDFIFEDEKIVFVKADLM